MDITKEILEHRWDEVAAEHDLKSVIGIDLLTPESSPDPGTASLMAFLPLYIVATFHRCQRCGNCCKPNYRKWDKGVVLSRREASALKGTCRITKKNGQYLLPYPCQLMKAKGCSRYTQRPYGCRLFPFTTVKGADGAFRRGIIMLCPAAKDLYINTTLFLQALDRYRKESNQLGRGRFDIGDMETLKPQFEYNQVDPADLAYMKRLALNPFGDP